jgi:hypothetical protein
VYGVSLDVAATTNEVDTNNDEIVNVLKVITNAVDSVIRAAAANDHVSSSALGNLAGNVASKMKVPVSPFDKDLFHSVSRVTTT